MSNDLPENFHAIENDEPFHFSCHPGVPCFTECCRQLDLALSPYDVLRLKNRLQMPAGNFLEKYVIIEWDGEAPFPSCYLTMVDDGRASCVFVSDKGCEVYEDRPGACRAYPVGRGASRNTEGGVHELFVLVKEPHCKGFAEPDEQTIQSYFKDQELDIYNEFNDLIMTILQHERIKQGFRPSRSQLDQFVMALYNLDMFRQEMADGRISMPRPLGVDELQAMAGDDEALLRMAVRWLNWELFGEEAPGI